MATACTHCGAINPDDARYCNRCGALLGVAGDASPPPQEDAADSPPPATAAASETESGGIPDPGEAMGPGGPRPLEAEQPAPLSSPPPTLPGGGSVAFPREQAGGAFLEPVVISGELTGLPHRPTILAAPGLGGDQARLVRALFQEDPLLSQPAAAPRPAGPSFRVPWIILLLALALVIPALAGGSGANEAGEGDASERFTAVGTAYDLLAALPEGAPVLVYWAYDPATAGEVDLAALPVVSHLLERRARSLVVTTLPAALPTARRLYAEAAAGLQASGAGRLAAPWLNDGAFLTGGAAALPLVAQDLDRALGLPAEAPAPLLALVFAAQPEEVQYWLELVQPVNALDVVAVTGAAGDPMLRPYLAGGQLSGLVAGFDGAAAYQALRSVPLGAPAAARLDLQSRLQNWGGAVLLLVLLLGNLAHWLGGGRRG